MIYADGTICKDVTGNRPISVRNKSYVILTSAFIYPSGGSISQRTGLVVNVLIMRRLCTQRRLFDPRHDKQALVIASPGG